MISSASSLLLSYSFNKENTCVSFEFENINLNEINLLQALLNEDFEQFSSNEYSEMFIEKNILVDFSKTEVI
jgi:hypothetical protein